MYYEDDRRSTNAHIPSAPGSSHHCPFGQEADKSPLGPTDLIAHSRRLIPVIEVRHTRV